MCLQFQEASYCTTASATLHVFNYLVVPDSKNHFFIMSHFTLLKSNRMLIENNDSHRITVITELSYCWVMHLKSIKSIVTLEVCQTTRHKHLWGDYGLIMDVWELIKCISNHYVLLKTRSGCFVNECLSLQCLFMLQ